jgi:hypothetical protein
MSDEIVINITPDPSINISAVDSNEAIALNPLTLNQGLINHSVTHQKNGSDELAHNILGGLQGGSGNQFYHLTSGEYSNLTTGAVVRPSETGQFYPSNNPSGYTATGYVTGISGYLQNQISLSNISYTIGDFDTLNLTAGRNVFHNINSWLISSFFPATKRINLPNSNSFSGDKLYLNLTSPTNITTTIYKPSPGPGYVLAYTIPPNTNFIGSWHLNNFAGSLPIWGEFSSLYGFLSSYDAKNIYVNRTENQTITGIKNFVSRPTVNSTGVILSGEATTQTYVTGISGGLQSQISNLNSATGSYVLDNETGNFYTNDNPSGFITGVDLSNYVLNSETGIFITGIDNLVYTTGDQKISGIKIFGSNNNVTNSENSNILAGELNSIFNSYNSIIAGGINNKLYAGSSSSSIINGVNNSINQHAFNSVIIGGNNHTINAPVSTIVCGAEVTILNNHTGAAVLADGQSRPHYSKGEETCSLDFAGGVFIDSDLNISGTLLTNNRPLVNGSGVLLVGESSSPADVVYQTGDQTISGIKTFTTGLNIASANHQITLGTGEAGNKITLTTPLNIAGNRVYTIPDIGSSAAFVLTQGSQTINGSKTFNSSIVGNGLFNLFPNEAGDSPHSLLTQQQLMLNGHKFRQLVNIFNNKTGTNVNTISQAFQVLGMKTQIGNQSSQAAAAFTLDSIFCADTSTANIPINNEIDAFFHGVAMQFQENTNWVARINFGVPTGRVVPFSDSPPTSSNKQWGVEFYSLGSSYYGRLYHYFGSLVYGDPFLLPVYVGATAAAWQGFIYSIRMRQFPIATNTLRIEFYMNESSSNNGGTALSKTDPLALLNTPTLTTPNYRLDGKHINFEVASSSINAPLGAVRMQCSNMYCQFK